MIEVTKYIDLKPQIHLELSSYINDEFGHIPIVKETEWANPDWTIVYYEHQLISTFCNVVETVVNIDNKNYKIGGINNLITPKKYRGKGYASKILTRARDLIFVDLKCELGLLFCADELVPFYERLNWYKVDCPVYIEQPKGVKLWESTTMLLTNKEKLSPQSIELNGLPW